MTKSFQQSRIHDGSKGSYKYSPSNKSRNPPRQNLNSERQNAGSRSSNRAVAQSPTFRFGNGDTYRPEPRNRDSYRPPNRSEKRAQKNEFTFRSNKNAPKFSPNEGRNDARRIDRRPRDQRDHARRGRGGSFRGQRSMNDRPLLRSKREATPENMLLTGDSAARFKDVDDLSESDAEMDLEEDSASASDEADEESRPAKKIRTDEKLTTNSTPTPKWSNPDPYAIIPPIDEAHAKRKDVVKLIRKAKVDLSKDATANGISENIDFISFGAEDQEQNSQESKASADYEASVCENYEESQSFSHLKNLHGDFDELELSIKHESSSQVRRHLNSSDMWPPPDNGINGGRAYLEEDIPQNSRKRKRSDLPDGSILPEWVCKSVATATPWCTVDHSRTDKMGLW